MSSTDETRDTVTTRTYHETVAPDGSKSGQETTTTHSEAHQESKSGVDPAQVEGMIQVALKAALATTGLGGVDWAGMAGGAVGLLGTGVALVKHAEAKRHRTDAQMYKADADKARNKQERNGNVGT